MRTSIIRTCSNNAESKSNRVSLADYLQSKIRLTGPITVGEYMKIVLTNPSVGYYMNRDVLGKEGDFITSPEISQMFGEMVAVWVINEWQKIGSPKPLQLIELGPGRGTMMTDILRVFKSLRLSDCISCHLVEISPELSKIQAHLLCVESKDHVNNSLSYKSGITKNNITVNWYRDVRDVPRKFSFILAHEFFDALPVHKFQKTKEGWREVLIDIDDNSSEKLRYVLSRSSTPASKLFIKENETRDQVEVSPYSGVIMQHIADRLEDDGGIALVVDYGHDGSKTDTFRGFRHHQLHEPLVEPGSADLTADVDFSYLRDNVKDKLVTFGPVNQCDFLTQLQIEIRLQMLQKHCTSEEQRQTLKSGFDMLMDKDKMGARFKFMSFFPSILQQYLSQYPPEGFKNV